MSEYRPASGELAARIHGAGKEMRERAQAARDKAAEVERTEPSTQRAASLRGKARGYDEAADLLEALDRGRRLPRRKRWTEIEGGSNASQR